MPRTKFENGIAVPDFDHNNHNRYEACGYSPDEMKNLSIRYNTMIENLTPEECKDSVVFEKMCQNFSKIECILIMKSVEMSRKIDRTIGSERAKRLDDLLGRMMSTKK